MLTRPQIAADLERLGLRPGDTVVLHSSLRSLGKLEGGPEAVIFALIDVLGKSGLLIFPTFTYRTQVFDPTTEPARTGLIPETARHWPGAVRSWHPTHSVTAVGRDAADLCAGHEHKGGFELDTPLDRAAQRGGYVLLLGVGHNTNSTIHVGESHAGVPYLDVPFSGDAFTCARVLAPTGPIDITIRQPPGCSKAFGSVERPLRERGAVRDGKVGEAIVQLVRSKAVIEATVGILTANPAALLCTDPHCYRCTQARTRFGE